MRIRIKKLAENPGGIAARKMEKHVPGLGDHQDGLSLPVEYEIEGELIGALMVGNSVRVARDKRNGVPADSLFISSPVVNINISTPPSAGRFHTRNSVYEYEFIEA